MHETKQFTAIGSVCLLAQARADKSIRLVLILKNGLQDFAKVLQASGVSPLPNEAMQVQNGMG